MKEGQLGISLDTGSGRLRLFCESLARKRDCDFEKGIPMLWTIAVLLLILWMLGMVSSYTLGGFIHILLVLAVIAVLVRLIQGRSPAL
jgi:hypothetical protein